VTEIELRAPAHLVSRKARAYWTVRALPVWLVIGGIETLILADDTPNWVRLLVVGITVVLALGHLVVMPQWRYRVHRWEVAPAAVYTRAGWVHQESRIAPISRIQTVDSERGPLEQLFGLANVTVTTASAAGPLEIEGLDRDTAQRLVDTLTTAAQATRGDAT
jgi:membrane protein YdbS with pleckstrin-like domain